ncbi:MAG: EAL domain-containing protein [Cyanobacteria bacterium P01_F01_bin.150]
MEQTNELAVERLELFFTDLQSSFLAGRHIIQNQDKTRLFLLSLLSKHPYISGVQLVDYEGNIIASEMAFVRRRNDYSMDSISQLESFNNQEFLVEDVVYEAGQSYVHIGVPISNELGLSEKILIAEVELTDLWLQAIDIKVPANGYVYIRDKNGANITYPNRQFIGPQQSLESPPRYFGYFQKIFTISRSLDHAWVLKSVQPLRSVPWMVVVEKPLSQVFKPMVGMVLGLMFVLVLMLFLLYDIMQFTRLRLILPLTALQALVRDSLNNKSLAPITASAQIHDLLKQFPSHSEDELTNFANVHLQLQDAKQAVERLNRELEERVLERTAQLELEVKERQQAQEKLLHMALHDPLTGLPNRMWLMERLSQELDRSQKDPEYKFALLFLDGDRFKLINDSLGHTVGDRLLVAVAERLRVTLPGNCHIARLGGDEFTVLIESLATTHQAKDIAQLLIDSLVYPFQLDQQRLFFNVSIGISVSDRNYDDPTQLLRDADIAMYEAKASPQIGYQLFDGLMRQRTIEQMQLETDLQQAIARNQLYLNYQPIIDLKSGQLAGFEALVRWHHHQKGSISPAQFVPIAEETGLIIAMDLWVLQQACQQMIQWQNQLSQHSDQAVTLPFRMGVNLSARQFAQRELLDRLDEILVKTGISPHNLKLEITETALLDSPYTAQMLLTEIKARQIQLAIDDFGMGYSSLSYLHQFPVHTLKIDQSFVRKLEMDKSIEPIIRTMITLAHNLNMNVIAEGIEENIQRLKLEEFGCDLGQGYFFAKPLTIKQATVFIQQQLQQKKLHFNTGTP